MRRAWTPGTRSASRWFGALLAATLVACDEGGSRSSVPSPSPTLTATATATALRTPTPTPEATSGATPAPSTPVPATTATAAPAPTLPVRTPGAAPGAPPVITSTRTPTLPPDTPVSSTPAPPGPPIAAPTPTRRVEVPRTSPPPLAPSQRRELAPIERLEMRVTPSEVVVDVTTGLPSGCAVFDYVGIERSGSTVTLTLWNTFPADERVACTAIYGFMPHTVPLGPFAPGQYTLVVHNETRTFSVP